MRRWQTIFRIIWAIYLGFSVSSIDFLPIFRCFDIESFVESFSRMSNDTISNENVCSPLERSWKKDMGDQISVKSNRILSVFSILSTLFEKKMLEKSSLLFLHVIFDVFFRDWPYLYAYLPSIHVYLQWIISQSIHRCLAASCFRLSILPLTYCDSQTIMNRSSILSVVWWHMRVRNWEFIDDDLAQIWISL